MTNAPTETRHAPAGPHETAGPPTVGDTSSFPSFSELTRTLIEPGGIATLSTLTWSGHPYASIAPYSVLANGAPVVCISDLAEHTQNLRRDPRASVLVEALAEPGVDPLSLSRVTVLGSFVPYEPSDCEIDAHLDVHPFARHYVGFADFSWWRFDVANLRYVGGFGVMGWGTGEEYRAASADPVIPAASPMIDHLNADHADSCAAIVRHLAGVAEVERADVTSIDRYGMTFDARSGSDHLATARVAFVEPLTAPEQVRAASIELVRRASSATPA
ncbi:HugZ family protein [Ilumatobacter sp.]|uniref:HugZ family pyridoxamine 5'-phosphate oxidase n=1 Tax=Ilumatobacter sp. TaxID=1967498 RepID=UPI003C394069